MAGSDRLRKINEEILRELTRIVSRLRDPRLTGIISITRVDTTKDLSQTKVYVSVLDGDAPAVLKTLKAAASRVRHELALALSLRHTPAPLFLEDHSMEHGAKVQEKLREINAEEHVRKTGNGDVGSVETP